MSLRFGGAKGLGCIGRVWELQLEVWSMGFGLSLQIRWLH